MAKEAKKDNKNIIIGACVAVAVVVVIIIAVILGTKGSPKLDDSYFVSDNTKYVLTVDTSDEEDESAPKKSHIVFTYSGDTITGMKEYYEFADEASAKAAVEVLKEETESPNSVSVDGKYVIRVADKSEYEGKTTEDVKSLIELYESMENDSDDFDYDEEDIDIEDEE